MDLSGIVIACFVVACVNGSDDRGSVEGDQKSPILLAKEEEYLKLEEAYLELEERAEPYLKLSADELAAEEAARSAKKEAEKQKSEKAAEERKKKEAEEKARLEEEAKGYETGITFNRIARSPDDF